MGACKLFVGARGCDWPVVRDWPEPVNTSELRETEEAGRGEGTPPQPAHRGVSVSEGDCGAATQTVQAW